MDKPLFIWWIPNPPCNPFKFAVSNPEEGYRILSALAQYDLYLGENIIYANAGGLYYENGDEWEDDVGRDVWQHFEEA